jgi:acetyl esterase/lipase
VQTIGYGDEDSNVADLHLPAGNGPFPLVVLVHGGFWRAAFDRTLMTPLAEDLVGRGWAAWNIEYRRVGQAGGGWPGTFDDVARAVDVLAELEGEGHPIDLDRIVTVGHSAGGHLALWAAASCALGTRGAVSQAGVVDLVAADRDGLGNGAAAELLGGHHDEVPDRYHLASPLVRLPLGVRQLLVHGTDDDRVPIGQSRVYAEAAASAGDTIELVELDGVGHFEVIDPTHAAWAAVTTRLDWLSANA